VVEIEKQKISIYPVKKENILYGKPTLSFSQINTIIRIENKPEIFWSVTIIAIDFDNQIKGNNKPE
jgi:hypothetical protein